MEILIEAKTRIFLAQNYRTLIDFYSDYNIKNDISISVRGDRVTDRELIRRYIGEQLIRTLSKV